MEHALEKLATQENKQNESDLRAEMLDYMAFSEYRVCLWISVYALEKIIFAGEMECSKSQ